MSGLRRPGARRTEMPSVAPVSSGDRPFWSVMIPCYNRADLLAAALEGVLAQDPGPDSMQIEVVDDGSTLDDPSEVVDRIGGGRVGYFRQSRNVGPSANFTDCVRRSRGRWVHILHGDDMVRPGFYERYRDRIETCPDVVMVGGRSMAVDAEGRDLAVTVAVAEERGYLLDPAFTLAAINPLRCVSVVVARRAYERVGGFHPDLMHANDWEMWSRLANLGPVGWVEEPLGLYRMHEGSDTARLHRATGYVSDCATAADLIASYFEKDRREVARRAARRNVCEYALSVGSRMLEEGEWRLAAANAARAVRIDQSRDVLLRAWGLLTRAAKARAGR